MAHNTGLSELNIEHNSHADLFCSAALLVDITFVHVSQIGVNLV